MPHGNYSCTKQSPFTPRAPRTTHVRNKGLGLHKCTTTQQGRHCRLQPAQRQNGQRFLCSPVALSTSTVMQLHLYAHNVQKKKNIFLSTQTSTTVPHSVWQNSMRGFTLHCFLQQMRMDSNYLAMS